MNIYYIFWENKSQVSAWEIKKIGEFFYSRVSEWEISSFEHDCNIIGLEKEPTFSQKICEIKKAIGHYYDVTYQIWVIPIEVIVWGIQSYVYET